MSGLIIAVPSKGRLKEQVEGWLADCGLKLEVTGGARGYLASLKGLPGAQVRLLSAADIADALDAGEVHLGITGEDLLRERGEDLDQRQGLDERACASYMARIARALEDISGDIRAIRDEHCKSREVVHAHRCGAGVVFVASATTHKHRDVLVGAGGQWRVTRTKAAGQALGFYFTTETADAAASQLARAGVAIEWQ